MIKLLLENLRIRCVIYLRSINEAFSTNSL